MMTILINKVSFDFLMLFILIILINSFNIKVKQSLFQFRKKVQNTKFEKKYEVKDNLKLINRTMRMYTVITTSVELHTCSIPFKKKQTTKDNLF